MCVLIKVAAKDFLSFMQYQMFDFLFIDYKTFQQLLKLVCCREIDNYKLIDLFCDTRWHNDILK